MSKCCDEPGCRRSQGFKIRRGPFSDRYYLITRWKLQGPNGLYAIQKHDIDDELRALLSAEGWVRRREEGSEGE